MENKELIIEKTKQMLSGHVYSALKEAAEAWLAGVDGADEAALTENYKAMLREGIMTLDEVIDMFANPDVIAKFGADMAKGIHDHAAEVKANGGVYCDCPACTLAQEILSLL